MTAPASGKGSFFAVDRRIWEELCEWFNMNEVVAYLVLACGTGRDNRTTSWSSQAVHRYAGIAWERGKAAIARLVESSYVRLAKASTTQLPRYELVPHETGECNSSRDDLIWLPNTIVTGTSSGEPSPIHRLRSAGDLWALRLFVDLYHAQNLRDDGGVNPQVICENYERKMIAERGIYTIWGFRCGQKQLRWAGPLAAHKDRRSKKKGEHPVWHSIQLLEQMGLVTFIPHLFENSSPQAEPIHPYGINQTGEEPIETEIGEAADAAALQMCQEWAIEKADNEGFEHFCPVPRTKPDVQLIGVARLRYRPHTMRTAEWYAQLNTAGSAAIVHYTELARSQISRDEHASKIV